MSFFKHSMLAEMVGGGPRDGETRVVDPKQGNNGGPPSKIMFPDGVYGLVEGTKNPVLYRYEGEEE